MPAPYRRPLLAVSRAQTRASCEAEGLTWWDDPMNEDPAHARVRARRALGLPVLSVVASDDLDLEPDPPRERVVTRRESLLTNVQRVVEPDLQRSGSQRRGNTLR